MNFLSRNLNGIHYTYIEFSDIALEVKYFVVLILIFRHKYRSVDT
jgi:hypothetical protein